MQRQTRTRRWTSRFSIAVAIAALGWLAAPGLRTPRASERSKIEERPGTGVGSGGAGGAAAVPGLPRLRTRARNPHLIEDENGKPFFIAGVCPQSILHWSTPEQMDVYFADREKRHFNFAWVVINAFDSQGKDSLTNPTDARGNAMLLSGTSWDPENLNPAYVASVDAMVKSAADHGIYLFLDPFSSGYEPGRAALTLPGIPRKKCANGVSFGATVTSIILTSISPWETTGWFGPRWIAW